jgi:anaerobic magnesium-protoporphyrin IX monomethyl ester cyclase
MIPARPKVVLVRPHPGSLAKVCGVRLPLALLRLAGMLLPDFEVAIVDMAREPDWRARLRRELSTGRPLLLGVGTMTGPQLAGALAASELCRAVAPDITIAWGGVHPTLFPEATAREACVDAVVVGEGEHSFQALARAVADGGDWSAIPGLAFERDGDVQRTERRSFLDMDTLPPLPLQLVEVSRYLFSDFGVDRLIELETSRGCPFDCSYCYNLSYHRRRWRAQSAERVLDDLARYQRDHGILGVGLVDDEFFIDAERARAIVAGLGPDGLGLRPLFQGLRVDTLAGLDPALLELLERCGPTSVQIGVESGSQAILDAVDKRITVEGVVEQNQRLARYPRLRPYYNFMAGFPGETPDDLRATVRLASRLLQDNPQARVSPLHLLTPYPGSALYERAVAEGFVPPRDAAGWARFDFHSSRPPWVSDALHDLARRVTVASLFVDDKIQARTPSRAAALLARLYRPVARRRYARQAFGWMPERHLFEPLMTWQTRRDARRKP